MNKDPYEDLIGQSKELILQIMDQPLTPYDSDEWVYVTGKGFLGFKKRLYLFFKDNRVYDYFFYSGLINL